MAAIAPSPDVLYFALYARYCMLAGLVLPLQRGENVRHEEECERQSRSKGCIFVQTEYIKQGKHSPGPLALLMNVHEVQQSRLVSY